MADSIFGEEVPLFTTSSGKTLEIKVCDTEEETLALLKEALMGNSTVAAALAALAHSTQVANPVNTAKLRNITDVFDPSSVGIWIDPIDSTASYIQGHPGKFRDGIVESS